MCGASAGENSQFKRRRRSTQTSRFVCGIESLEQRSLLSGISWHVDPVNFNAQEGSPVGSPSTTVEVATISDSSGQLNAGDFTAQILWGDGGSSSGSVIATNQPGTFSVQGAYVYRDEGFDLVHVTVSRSHSNDGAVTVFDSASVSDPPVVPTGGLTFTAVQAAAPAAQLLATFTDPGGNESIDNYSAEIDWGDKTVTPATVTSNPTGNDFLVTGGSDHIYTEPGTFTVTVTMSHDQAPNATTTSTATVTQPPIVVEGGFTYPGIEGSVGFNHTVATFTDPAGPQALSSYSAAIVWGDGTTTAGTISHGTVNQFTVVGRHSYPEERTGPIEVIVDHGTNLPVTVTGTYSIADAPVLLFAPGLPIAAEETTPLVNVTVATFIDQGGLEAADDYTAEIDWGDGTISAGTVSLSAAAGNLILGSHTYLEGGRHPITVTLHHDSLSPDPAVLASAEVAVPPVAPTASYTFTATENLLSASQPVATFTDPGGAHAVSEYSATIDWGDGGAADAGSITFDANADIFTVSGQHTYAEEGTYPVTVLIDHDPQIVTVVGVAKVNDAAVLATGNTALSAQEFRLFGPQTLAVFNDPAGAESSDNYSATIHWPDGTSSTGTIALNTSGTAFNVLASHTFTQSGSQTVGITIHHDTAPDATVQSTVNVGQPPIALTASPMTWRAGAPLEAPDNALADISFVDNTSTVTIDWGDGTTTRGSVSPYLLGGAGAALGSHTWTETGRYNVTVTVNDSSSQASANFPVTVIQGLLPVPNPSQATPNEYYVAKLYEDILKRFVDGWGLMYWSTLLDQGLPRSTVVSKLLTSDEYLTNFVIDPAYEKYLGRAADPGGTQFWLGQFHSGMTDAELAASFASSQEFYLTAGGGTNAGFVDALYRIVLGRAADTAGETYWLNQLATGATPYSVVQSFVTGGEDHANFIKQTYLALLGRGPSSTELAQWLANFQSWPITDDVLIASLAAGDEYYDLAVTD